MTLLEALAAFGVPVLGLLCALLGKIIWEIKGDIKELHKKIENDYRELERKRDESLSRAHQRVDVADNRVRDLEITVAGLPAIYISKNECDRTHRTRQP